MQNESPPAARRKRKLAAILAAVVAVSELVAQLAGLLGPVEVAAKLFAL